MEPALLLIAHGSRQPEANADLAYVVGLLQRRGRKIVEASYLELAEPNIDEGGERLRCAGRAMRRVAAIFSVGRRSRPPRLDRLARSAGDAISARRIPLGGAVGTTSSFDRRGNGSCEAIENCPQNASAKA